MTRHNDRGGATVLVKSLGMLFRRVGQLPKDILAILAQRAWQAGAGLVTVLIAVRFLSAEEQGWYYSFLSLSALYTLFDLGLSLVLVQITAHHFVRLQWMPLGGIAGRNRPHIHALLSATIRWYAFLAVLFIVLAIPGGMIFFSVKGHSGFAWQAPWIALVVATGAALLGLPFLSIIEGSGRVAEVYTVRLIQAIIGSVACWTTLIYGGGLWATVMMPSMAAIVPLVWLSFSKPRLLRRGLKARPAQHLEWRHEVWPLQWRLALGWVCAYMMMQIYTPVLFRTHGAVVAGQMGLSLAIVNMLSLLSQSWIARRVPAMGRAAAQRNWKDLNRLFIADFSVSSIVFLLGALTLCGAYLVAHENKYTVRLLPFWQLLGLIGVAFLQHIIGALAAQLRSFRREPIMRVTVLTTLITVPAGLFAVERFSSAGVVFVLFSANLIVSLPLALYLWKTCNQELRREV